MDVLGRVLGIDPGDVWIGLAVSDETRSLSRPLQVIKHTAREADAAAIAQVCNNHQIKHIVIGITYDDDGNPSPQGRKSVRLGEAIRKFIELPITYWDETLTTQTAVFLGSTRRRKGARKAHQDDLAAAILLQGYLDSVYEAR